MRVVTMIIGTYCLMSVQAITKSVSANLPFPPGLCGYLGVTALLFVSVLQQPGEST